MTSKIILFLIVTVIFNNNVNAIISAGITSYTNASCSCCSDGTATVAASGGSGHYSYLWSTGDTTATVSDLSSGNYSVTVTDRSNSATAAASVTIGPAAWDWALVQGGSGYNGEVANMEGNTSDIAADKFGNTYVIGAFDLQGFFGGIQLSSAGGFDVFLVKYDADGNVIWTRTMGGTGDDIGKAVALDPSGNICITGHFESDTMYFGSYALLHNGGAASTSATNNHTGRSTIFTAEYDSSGNLLWAKKGGGNYTSGNYDDVPNDRAYAITTDKAGNVFVTGGVSSDTVIFDTVQFINSILSGSIGRIFIAKYNSTGNILWAQPIEVSGDGRGMGIATDSQGNVFITGLIDGNFTFLNNNYTTSGWDIFTAKYDPLGHPLWGELAGSPPDDAGHAIAVDRNGDAYVTGWLQGSPGIFGADTLISTTTWDIFVVKYDGPTGNTLWAKRAGSVGIDEGYGITVDNCQDVYLTGAVGGSGNIAYFDTLSISSTGYLATFIACYNSQGNALFVTSIDGPPAGNSNDDIAYGICTDFEGNILITGGFGSDSMDFGCISIPNEGANGDIFIAKMINTANSASVNIPASYSVCEGDSVVLTATGTGNYNWIPSYGLSDTTGASVTARPTLSTTYTVTSSFQGCGSSAVTTVNVRPSPDPAITLTDSLICSNDSALLCVADTFISYVWNTGAITSCTPVSQAGGYWVSVTNSAGCAGVSSHREISVYPVPPVSIAVSGDTLSSFGAISYQWFLNDSLIPGATAPVYVVHQPGNYAVQIVDSNGCSATSNIVQVVVTAVPGEFEANRLSVYPNPASNEVFITLTGNNDVNTLRFYNSLGQEVKQFKINRDANNPIPIDDLPAGLYEVALSGHSSFSTAKLMKQ